MIGLFAISGRSMSPALEEGDLVVTVSPRWRRPLPGAIVVAETPFGPVAHRVVAVAPDGAGREYLRLAGDANRGVDPYPVPASAVLGIVTLRLAGLGRLRLRSGGRRNRSGGWMSTATMKEDARTRGMSQRRFDIRSCRWRIQLPVRGAFRLSRGIR